MYLTESFSSGNIKKLFKNKKNLDIFKKDVFPKTHISWDSISDEHVNVNSIRQGIKDYIKSNDSYVLSRFVLPTSDEQGITVYTHENNTIHFIFDHNNNIHYVGDYNMYHILVKVKDIIKNYYESFHQMNLYVNKVEDIRDYLYISNDKVDVLRTLYKMLLMSCYSLKWHHMCPFTEAGDFLMNNFWRNEHGSEIIYHVLNNIKDKNGTFECVNGKYKTKFVIKTNQKEYYFDFEVRGLSDDDVFKRIDEYVEYLYEIDSARKIKKSFFNDYPKYMFVLAETQDFLRIYEDDYDDSIFDRCIPLFNFAAVMFLFDKKVTSNTTYQVILASIVRYLSVSRDTVLIRYTVEPTSVHVKDYSNKIRKRQLNKITSIETDQSVSDETYHLAKEMMKYIWLFKNHIRKFSNKFGYFGKYILKAYNSLLIIDNMIIKMADDNAPVMQRLFRNNSGYIKHQYETLKDNVEAFIDVISEITSENFPVERVVHIYNDIREQYDNLFGIYNHEDFDE